MLFPKEIIEIFKDNCQPVFNPQLLTRCGIVLYIDNKPHIIHRTVAEYYVVDFLIDRLSKETTPEQVLLDFLLKAILLKENCEVICSFLDGFLEKCKVSRGILEHSRKRICELWTDDADGCIGQKPLRSSGQTILHQAARVGHAHIIRYVLGSLKAGQHLETMHDIFLTKDEMGQTEVYEWVAKVIKNHQEQKELLKELFLHKDKDEQTIWHLAAQSIHPDVFKKLLDVADKALSKEELWLLLLTEDMMGQTAWHLSAENGRAESLNTLWEWAKKVHLNENELKNNWLLSHDSTRMPGTWQHAEAV